MNDSEASAAIQARFDAEPDVIPAPVETPAPAAETAAPGEAPPAPAEVPAAVPDQPAQPEPTSVDSRGSEPARSKNYQDFLTKYGGDEDKAAEAYWATNNRAAQLARENEELKARLAPAAPTAAAPAPPVTPVAPPELQRFDTDLRTFEKDYSDTLKQEKQYLAEHERLGREINRLTRNLASGRIAFEQEGEAKEKLSEMIEQQETYEAWVQRFQQDRAAIDRAWRLTSAQRAQAETLMQFQSMTVARETEAQEAARQTKLKSFAQTFFGSMPVIAKEGTPIPDDEMADFQQFVKDKALVQLTGADTNLMEADIPAFQRQVKAEYQAFTDRAHKRRSAAYAKLKVQDATTAAPEGSKAVAQETKRTGFASKSEVDAAINAALG